MVWEILRITLLVLTVVADRIVVVLLEIPLPLAVPEAVDTKVEEAEEEVLQVLPVVPGIPKEQAAVAAVVLLTLEELLVE